MISIVVCSVNNTQFADLSENIASTIGIPYEIIRIDNAGKQYNLCQAYNKGKAKCNYEIICFMHEDICIYTNNWGEELVRILSDHSIGLLGVLGACYLSLYPPDWIDPKEVEGQIVEGYKPGNPILRFERFPSAPLAEVAAVDGVFMATRADVLNNIRFSEDILTGFHGYDFDLSMQIRQNYKVVITRTLVLKHMSAGNFNASYYEAVRSLSRKWKDQLPVYVKAYTNKEITGLKLRSLEQYSRSIQTKRSFLGRAVKNLAWARQQKVLLPWLFRFLTDSKK